MYHIIYCVGGNLIRDATPYASVGEAYEEMKLMKEMKMEVTGIVFSAEEAGHQGMQSQDRILLGGEGSEGHAEGACRRTPEHGTS